MCRFVCDNCGCESAEWDEYDRQVCLNCGMPDESRLRVDYDEKQNTNEEN